MPGADNLIVEARAALLDAVAALEVHKDSVILIGAQAIYLRTGNATFALAEATKDSDLAIDPRKLGEDPRLEEAMTDAGFIQPGQPAARCLDVAQRDTRRPDGPRASRWLRQTARCPHPAPRQALGTPCGWH
jgi:hypothetical protein